MSFNAFEYLYSSKEPIFLFIILAKEGPTLFLMGSSKLWHALQFFVTNFFPSSKLALSKSCSISSDEISFSTFTFFSDYQLFPQVFFLYIK